MPEMEARNLLPNIFTWMIAGGFLEGTVSRENGKPTLIFRHYDPDENVLNEYIIEK